MNRRWILVKESDGQRGIDGKKKIYEIVLEDNMVEILWGMFEKGSKQTDRKYFSNSQKAMSFAYDKYWAKIGKGYELVVSA
jgi:predicted DNA-binding WGR domain protein